MAHREESNTPVDPEKNVGPKEKKKKKTRTSETPSKSRGKKHYQKTKYNRTYFTFIGEIQTSTKR